MSRKRIPRTPFYRPLGIDQVSAKIMQRLLSKTRVEGDCWIFTGYTDHKGYGQIKVDGRAHWAHRVAYVAFVGPIKDGMTVNHKCGCTACMNPAHLELMTVAENTAEGNRRRAG